jgi:hypothetical protein
MLPFVTRGTGNALGPRKPGVNTTYRSQGVTPSHWTVSSHQVYDCAETKKGTQHHDNTASNNGRISRLKITDHIIIGGYSMPAAYSFPGGKKKLHQVLKE